jgi:hypothetical protein
MKSEIISTVRTAIEDPAVARNAQGKLAKAIAILSRSDQMELACDFAEHVAWVPEERSNGDRRFRDAIHVIRMFIRGRWSMQQVYDVRRRLFQADNDLLGIVQPSKIVFSTSSACAPIKTALEFCCGDALVANGFLINLGVRSAIAPNRTAEEACFSVARHQGGDEWDSDEVIKRRAARNRGRIASENEATWQLNHLIDYLEDS